MDAKPYASPLMDGPVPTKVPALWDPEVAADWSLLFSPAFGAALQMRNWQLMGRPHEAAMSRNWVIGSLIFGLLAIVLSVQLGSNGVAMSCSLYLILLLVWYQNSAKAQAMYVKRLYGQAYPHREWGKPIALVVGLIVYVLVCLYIGRAIAAMRLGG